jgi:hypothetical protein
MLLFAGVPEPSSALFAAIGAAWLFCGKTARRRFGT